MFDLKPISLVIGILLTTLGCAMIIPAMVDLAADNDDWMVFTASAGFTLFIGVSLSLISWGRADSLTVKQAFILTTASWVALVAFAAVPMAWSGLDLSYTDAFFEAMSGLTTTGSTIIVGLDNAPPGLLIWRALLQWLGGVGIIVMAIAVLPMLQVGGMQLFKVEAFDTSEKILPRAAQISGMLSLTYVAITAICTAAYFAAGMSPFDATIHALTTISTGGFSSYDASLGHFNNHPIEIVSIVFMVIGSLPFLLLIKFFHTGSLSIVRDSQVRWFLMILLIFILILWAYQVFLDINQPLTALRTSAFNVISIMTGTGYVSTDYEAWGPFTSVFFFCLMFIGGCAGSTSCGIKIFRFQVIAENVKVHINRMLFPNGVFVARYNHRQLPDNVSAAVMSFFFLFFLCFGMIALTLNIIGLDNLTAMSAAATAIANVGPGLGSIVGPVGNFATLPDSAKWILSIAMLLGRLELFTVLVLLTPAFWRA